MPTKLQDAKAEFTAAMKTAKKFVADNKWCCFKHELVAQLEITVFSTVKNAALREFKEGKMDEETFTAFIQEGTKVIIKQVARMQSEQEEKAVVNSINMPCPAEAS